jgi:hypothetical protein
MFRIVMRLLLLLLLLPLSAFSQHETKEGCHVYVVDTDKVKAIDSFTPAQLKECEKNPEKCGVKDFPNFVPNMGEEELTTQTYEFPWAALKITANVFMTDEMWIGDTATLTITLAESSPKNVQADENSAQADIVLQEVGNAAKVKRYYRIKNKQYLVGLQCVFGKLGITGK